MKFLTSCAWSGPPLGLKNGRSAFKNRKTGTVRFVNARFLAALPIIGQELLIQRQRMFRELKAAGWSPIAFPIVVDRRTCIRLRVRFTLTAKQIASDFSIPDFDNLYTAAIDALKKIGLISDDRFLLAPMQDSEITGDNVEGFTAVEFYSDDAYRWKV